LCKETIKQDIGKGRGLYFYVLEENVEIEGISIEKWDSVEITDKSSIEIKSLKESKLVMLKVPL
jgi:hypothetical protein